jgi:hypothetical protein
MSSVVIIAGGRKDWVTSYCKLLRDSVYIETLQRFSTFCTARGKYRLLKS